MDVTFRESVPFYGEKTYLSFLFEFDSTTLDETRLEGENDVVTNIPIAQELEKMEAVISCSSLQPAEKGELNPTTHEDNSVSDVRYKNSLKVYTWRNKIVEAPHVEQPQPMEQL
jgi:hypothetical protein